MKTWFAPAVLLLVATSGLALADQSPGSPTDGNETVSSVTRQLISDPWKGKASMYFSLNVDLVGNDLRSVPVAGLEVNTCKQICKDDPDCYCSTWTEYNGGTCWLKNFNCLHGEVTPKASSDGDFRSSMWVLPEFVPTATKKVIYNCDLQGGDFRNAPGANIDECYKLCKFDSNCEKVTWNNHNGGTCWFKRYDGQAQACTPREGVHSAIVFFQYY